MAGKRYLQYFHAEGAPKSRMIANFMFDTVKCPTNVSTNNWCGEQSLELNLREALQAGAGLQSSV